ncbi:alpha/beta hydrolase [Streptomyces liliifuscus]|uniref:Dienelactone hydrolase family protein n=1 Tax=Streptomyces liliifuscus TaxID=2797636 RepID=A0A7T7KTG8_9ACTN|nr:alpha/beta fold hydrolase [Streptomyces liliifuscus]QQM38132.1 dienelactone hydrolase family protein [Streptomyces liliifuscus]
MFGDQNRPAEIIHPNKRDGQPLGENYFPNGTDIPDFHAAGGGGEIETVRTDFTFLSNGPTPAGHLHTPVVPADSPMPAIVVVHPWGGVKEQAAGLYAQRLAEHGYAVLAFDAAYQGASEGEPHFLENPFQRAEDINRAVSYLSTRQDVDSERIGVLGISTGGGHAANAAVSDQRIKATGTVSAADVGSLLRDGLSDGRDPSVFFFSELVARAGQLRTEGPLGEPAVIEHIVPEEVDETAPGRLRQGHEYDRAAHGAHAWSGNAWVVPRSVDQIARYDSFAGIESLAPRPLLMIAAKGRAA